jgi:hypothetical protein
MIKAGVRKNCSEIHKLTNSIWNKEEMPEEWKELITVTIYNKADKTDCSNYLFYITIYHNNYIQNFVQHPAVNGNSICRGNYWGLLVWILTQHINY